MTLGTLILVLVLIVSAMVLITMEICTPFFGLFTITAVGLSVLAIYLSWSESQVFGAVTCVLCLVGLPVFTVVLVRKLPGTSFGRKLYLSRAQSQAGEGTPEAQSLEALVGRKTTAETVLRPSGTIRIEGRRIVAQAESGMIERGEAVRVVRASGNRVVVRKIEQQS